uniref:Uncharacterized protein n=1 Tax=Meloidogyne enterolobii TaxID=390850 RepID=A0A6V7VCY1_MELEN|nr:unnamed protein product [Meloidogyne enterolobii]
MENKKKFAEKRQNLLVENFENKEFPTPTAIKASNSHRPSPYLKRVRLPKLDFTIAKTPPTTISFKKEDKIDEDTDFYDKELPEDLISKIKLIQLKNEQIFIENQKRIGNDRERINNYKPNELSKTDLVVDIKNRDLINSNKISSSIIKQKRSRNNRSISANPKLKTQF